MPKQPERSATDNPKTLNVTPLRPLPKTGPGRPPKLAEPPMPEFDWQNDYERDLYHYFIAAIKEDYPGLKKSDLLLLPLAAAEYVKCLRLLGKEVASGELVMMSRQHPSTFFARYLDTLLGTTRKQRVKQPEKSEDEFDWSKLAG
jgi:hypothetical protein